MHTYMLGGIAIKKLIWGHNIQRDSLERTLTTVDISGIYKNGRAECSAKITIAKIIILVPIHSS